MAQAHCGVVDGGGGVAGVVQALQAAVLVRDNPLRYQRYRWTNANIYEWRVSETVIGAVGVALQTAYLPRKDT